MKGVVTSSGGQKELFAITVRYMSVSSLDCPLRVRGCQWRVVRLTVPSVKDQKKVEMEIEKKKYEQKEVKRKGKSVVSVYTMKVYKGRGGMAPVILNFGGSCR